MISVIIPVGPERYHQLWLDECLDSIYPQLKRTDEIILIDDMAGLDSKYESKFVKILRLPWRVGCADAWNFGIATAHNDLSLMMGADDWLNYKCLEFCSSAWYSRKDVYGYYALTIQYYNESTKQLEETQTLPCNAAMVHKDLWKHTGGFPPETGIGAPDAAFISILLGQGRRAGNIYQVAEGNPLYYVRRHKYQDTAHRGSYQGPIIEVRNILTRDWKPTTWGRYE